MFLVRTTYVVIGHNRWLALCMSKARTCLRLHIFRDRILPISFFHKNLPNIKEALKVTEINSSSERAVTYGNLI
jgi:hypothetical protein